MTTRANGLDNMSGRVISEASHRYDCGQRLIVARHGNTFGPQDTPTRVGRRTDLPLVPSGEAQARMIGVYLRRRRIWPDVVFAATLKRSYDTARLALQALGSERSVTTWAMFDEIDYGPDENHTEDDVIARIGAQALQAWNEHAKVPDGWHVDPEAIVRNWLALGERCCTEFAGKTVLVVTSNGIARFAPHLTGDFAGFAQDHSLKIATGALCIFRLQDGQWVVEQWNLRPHEAVA
ncbi:2,3-bisphosphoglycerate-dependent phosphoglycerate mutase [Candidatus Entotheonellaceae bacterium PAL068K]